MLSETYIKSLQEFIQKAAEDINSGKFDGEEIYKLTVTRSMASTILKLNDELIKANKRIKVLVEEKYKS